MTQQILRSTPATLELRVYSAGSPVNLDANPTLAITDGHGTVVSSGAVTKPSTPPADAVGVYRSVLPGQAALKVLKAAWSGLLATAPVTLYQDYEIVGNLLFTEADARNAKIVGGQSALADETDYPDALISGWRSTITELFEQRLQRPVIQRYCRLVTGGWGTRALDMTYGNTVLADGSALNRPGRGWDIARIITADVGGTAQTVGDLDIVGHQLVNTTGTWTGSSFSDPNNVIVQYEYGPDPVWGEAHQRGLDLLLANAAPKGFPSSATSVSTEDGTFRITNFPVAVEEFLSQHRRRKGFGVA